MYGYEWTGEYGIFRLTIDARLQKEIRPVFHEELDFFGMDEYWDYPKDTDAPLLWAEGIRDYVLNGECVAKATGGGVYTKPVIKRLTEKRLKLQPINIRRLYEVNYSLMVGLEQKAIHFIQETHRKYSEKGYAFVCAFSGGKDSLVLLDLVAKALSPTDFYVVFSNTGMELSTTLKAVEKAKERWPELRFREAKSHMTPSESWGKFGPPASRLRWCCSVHKSVPTILEIQKIAGKNRMTAVYDGVRGEESLRRSKYEEVGEGVKNIQQVNLHAILKWSSSEVFVYLLANNILLNDAYRLGMYRVGCKICPMSAKWQDALISFYFPDEISDSLKLLEKITVHAKGKLDKSYIEEGGWQARVGGRILEQGENRVTENIEGNTITFTLTNYKQNIFDVLPIFGSIVESNKNKHYIHTKQGMIEITVQEQDDELEISFTPLSRMDRFALSTLRSIMNKTAYCVGCKACVPQCPTSAFQIQDGKIVIREAQCTHCHNCCDFTEKGCMVAKSLYIRRDNMENPDKYRNFGFRQAFYMHFYENGTSTFDEGLKGIGVLGKDQYKALKQWLFEAGALKGETNSRTRKTAATNEYTELGERLFKLNPYDPLTWAIMWANLAYNSVVAHAFCLNIGMGMAFNGADLAGCLSYDNVLIVIF